MTAPFTTDAQLTRRERKALETRNTILEVACRLIQRDGYEATTIERIAEEADIAPRTFFRYFPNKEALLFAEFDAARDAMVAALAERPNDEDVLESVAVVLKRFSLEIDRRWGEFSWVREVTGAYGLSRSPDRIVASQEVTLRLAEFIADRLGVDMICDPRPAAWAKAITAAFGQAVLLGPGAASTGRTFDLFIELLHSTAETLRGVESIARVVAERDDAPLSHCHGDDDQVRLAR